MIIDDAKRLLQRRLMVAQTAPVPPDAADAIAALIVELGREFLLAEAAKTMFLLLGSEQRQQLKRMLEDDAREALEAALDEGDGTEVNWCDED